MVVTQVQGVHKGEGGDASTKAKAVMIVWCGLEL